MLDRRAREKGGKRGSAPRAPYQKVKVDRQILAIALVNDAEMLVSGDATLLALADDVGLKAVSIEQLPIPLEARQHLLEFEAATIAAPPPPS